MSDNKNKPLSLTEFITKHNALPDPVAQSPKEVAMNFYLSRHEVSAGATLELRQTISYLKAQPQLLQDITPRELDHGLETIAQLSRKHMPLERIFEVAFNDKISSALKTESKKWVAPNVETNEKQTLGSHIDKLRQKNAVEPTSTLKP